MDPVGQPPAGGEPDAMEGVETGEPKNISQAREPRAKLSEVSMLHMKSFIQ